MPPTSRHKKGIKMQLFWHTGAKLSFISKAVFTIQHESEAIWQKKSYLFLTKSPMHSTNQLETQIDSWEITRPWWAISWLQNNHLSVKSVSTIQHESKAIWHNRILPLFDEVPDAFHKWQETQIDGWEITTPWWAISFYGKNSRSRFEFSRRRRLLLTIVFVLFFSGGPITLPTW